MQKLTLLPIVGPQTFKASEKPGYHSAYIAMLIGYSIKLVAICALYAYMWSVNKKRDRAAAAAGILDMEETKKRGIESGMHDRTELENLDFRYTL